MFGSGWVSGCWAEAHPSGHPTVLRAVFGGAVAVAALGAVLGAVLGAALGAAPAGDVVALTQQPGSALEAAARTLAAQDLADAKKAGEIPALLVGSARLAPGRLQAALFIQVQSAALCGSAGCSTSVFLRRGKGWRKILDSVSGPIKVSPAIHRGMHDLLIDSRDRWVWDGAVYKDTLPGPAALGVRARR